MRCKMILSIINPKNSAAGVTRRACVAVNAESVVCIFASLFMRVSMSPLVCGVKFLHACVFTAILRFIMIHWILFIVLSFITYICISLVGYLSNTESKSVMDAVYTLLDIKIILLIIFSNIFFVSALYYGFLEVSFAITIAISIGVISSFIFSIFMYGVQVSLMHLLGVVCILAGIYLLR